MYTYDANGLPEWYVAIGPVFGTTTKNTGYDAVGLDIVMGWSGQFAFAHIAFFCIVIYGTALLNMRLCIPFLLTEIACDFMTASICPFTEYCQFGTDYFVYYV